MNNRDVELTALVHSDDDEWEAEARVGVHTDDDDDDEGGSDGLLLEHEVDFGAEGNSTRLLAPANIAIPVFYFILGFNMKFPVVALRQYMRLTLVIDPSMQALVSGVVMGLPWNFKMFYGFVSDSFPIMGRKRKPYMLFGIVICSLSWVYLGMTAAPSLFLVCFLLFFAVFGMIISDVMADTLVVERMHDEVDVGRMQSICWMLRFSGGLCGYLIGSVMLENFEFSSQGVFIGQGLVHAAVLLPAWLPLHDPVVAAPSEGRTAAVKQNLRHIWDAVQQKHIYCAMVFLYTFAVMPGNADAWANYLLGPLEFTDSMFSWLGAVGTAASALGTFVYKRWLSNVRLHLLFSTLLIVSCVMSFSQLVLVFRWNKSWHISDFAFAMGDDIIRETVGFMLQMPTLVMCARLCPKGVESTVYALLTVIFNVALQVSSAVSSLLIQAMGITLTNYDNLWMLTVVSSLCQLLPLLVVPLTPSSLHTAAVPSQSRSRFGGGICLIVLFGSLIWSTFQAALRLSQVS